MPALFSVLRRLGFCFAAAALLWTAGLVWFATPLAIRDSGAPAEAIVVLTGGSLRLQSGFKLLGEGKGRKLFVSGVNQEVKLNQLLRLAGNAPDWAACCVVLGYAADDTFGNAIETAEWMRRENYHSLRLVTAWYHMRRSLLEFARAMPGVTIIPHPVYPNHVRLAHWWEWRGTAALIVREYLKYLGALFRPLIGRLRLKGPRPAAAPAQ
ncbi:MAG TPA: YdcF family protein [Stellaceae bacterium]|nr:YdcF family protein [Stellaceae bacterium]